MSITNNVQIKHFTSKNLGPFPLSFRKWPSLDSHWFLYHTNHEHVLTLCKQDFAQLLTSPEFKHPLVPPPSVVLIIQVGHHWDVTLVHLDLRLPSTEPTGVSLLQHVLGNRTDKPWWVAGLSLTSSHGFADTMAMF